MATDAVTGQPIYSGPQRWGRTRSPKNLAGSQGGAVTPLANTNNLQGITASTEGYVTENQRYLHILIEDTNTTAPAVTTVFGYCHAFLRWFEIEAQTMGQAFAEAAANTAPTAASISTADSTRAPASQVPSDREYRVYHIVGIDRVAFVNSDPTEVNVFAAGSTF